MIFKTIENKDSDGNVVGTQVVSFIKARKIAQDELNKSLAEQATQLATDEQALRKLEDAIKSGAKYEDVFDDAMQGASKSAKEHAIATKGAAGSTDVFVEKQKQAQTQLQATTKASKAASVAMKALSIAGNMFLGMAISWGVSKIFEGIDNLIHGEEKAAKKIKELGEEAKSSIDAIKSGFESTKSTVDEVANKYAELAQKVGSLGKIGQNQGNLSNDEYQEFLDISNQLAELFPTLTKGYDDNGNAILDLSGDINTITSDLYRLVDAEKAVASIEMQEKMPDLFAGMKADNSDYSGQINQYQEYINLLNSWNNAKTSTPNIAIDELINQNEALFEKLFSDADLDIGDFYGKTFEELANDPVISEALDNAFSKMYQEYSTKVNNLSGNIEATNKNFGQYLVASLQGDINYEELGETQKAIVNSIFANLGYDTLFANKDWNEASDVIQQGIIDAIKNTDNEQVVQAIQAILSGDISQAEFEANIKLITNFDAENGGVDYSQWLSYFDTSEIESKVSSQTQRLFDIGGDNFTDQDKNVLSNWVKHLEPAELDALEKFPISKESIKNGAKQFITDLDKEIQNQLKTTELDVEVDVNPTTSIASAKEAFSGFESIYDEIMGGGTVSADSINGLTESFGGLNGGLALEHFRNVLTTMPDDIEAQKQALDDLANSYLDQTDLMQNLTEENKDYVISELEKIGVENAQDYVESRLNDTVKQLLSNLSKFSSVYAENYNAIKNAVKGSDEYEQSLQNLKDGLNELLSYEIDGETFTFDVSDDFVVENLLDIEAAANGSVDALNRVKQAATQDYVMNMNINAPSSAEADMVRQEINNLIAGFDINDVEVGTCLNDTPMIQGLNNLLDAGKITRDQMNSILAGVGVSPKITHKPAHITIPKNSAFSPVLAAASAGAQMAIQVPTIDYEVTGNAVGAKYTSPSSSNTGGGGGGGGGSSSSENETSETFDWIETKINRLEESISRLDKTATNTYDNWSNRNSALASEMSKVREEIDLQQQAYNRYMQEANSIGLSADYVKKIQSGELNIQTIKDETLIDKINQYTEWYNKAVQCDIAIQDLSITLGDLAQQSFDNISQEYSDFISLIEGSADIIDERINRVEEQGYFASSSYYQQMLNYESQEMAKLKEEYSKLISQRDSAIDSGAILKGSEAYQAMTQEIQGVQQAIEESTTATVELNNAIRDLNWEIFDYIEERIGKITDESNFLIDLLDNQSLYNENGSFNKRGQAAAYLHGQNAKIYAQQVKDYASEIKKINKDLANDPSNKDLIERREELLDLQQESISNIYAEKEAVKSLVEEGINKHLQSLTELIDKYKNAMNEAKSLYEYNKSISEQTSEISRLQKILQSYEGDDGEESRKAIQEYQNQLKDAQESLKETEWSQFISESEKLLDDLYSDYEETLNARLDNIDTLFTDVINGANKNANMINETIKSVAQAVGYDISMINKNPQDIKNSIQQKTTSDAVSGISTVTSSYNENKSYGYNTNNGNSASSGSNNSSSSNGTGHFTASGIYANSFVDSINIEGSKDTFDEILEKIAKYSKTDIEEVKKHAKLKGLKGYATGSRRIPYDQLAWTQENGTEIIYRASDGAMLTPLNQGDMVFTNEMSKKLFDIAQGNLPDFMSGFKAPTMVAKTNTTSVNNQNAISINLPNVTNYDEFKNALQKDSKFVGFMQEVTLGQALGKNKLNKNKY